MSCKFNLACQKLQLLSQLKWILFGHKKISWQINCERSFATDKVEDKNVCLQYLSGWLRWIRIVSFVSTMGTVKIVFALLSIISIYSTVDAAPAETSCEKLSDCSEFSEELFDEWVCASNGFEMRGFSGTCRMYQYNCDNKDSKFELKTNVFKIHENYFLTDYQKVDISLCRMNKRWWRKFKFYFSKFL